VPVGPPAETYPRRVPLLRRTPASTADTSEPGEEVEQSRPPQGKGRPTPKRRDAQKNRRRPIPRDRKEAERLRRERLREQRRLARQALVTGDERHLPARDQGPGRRLARDLVDSRFSLGQYALVLILVLFVLNVGVGNRHPGVALALQTALLVAAILVFGQAWMMAGAAQKRVQQQYGVEAARGIRSYALMRALSARRMRRPPPKVNRGAKV